METVGLFLAVLRPYFVDASSARDQRRSCSWGVFPGVRKSFAAGYTCFIIKGRMIERSWEKPDK